MPNLDYARCPHCHKTADGRTEVEAVFGYRIDAGVKKVQSWCKECR